MTWSGIYALICIAVDDDDRMVKRPNNGTSPFSISLMVCSSLCSALVSVMPLMIVMRLSSYLAAILLNLDGPGVTNSNEPTNVSFI